MIAKICNILSIMVTKLEWSDWTYKDYTFDPMDTAKKYSYLFTGEFNRAPRTKNTHENKKIIGFHFKDRGMFWNYKIEFDFSELSSSSSYNKACDAWGPPCYATMYSSSLLLNIPTLIIIHLFLQSRRWIAFTRQTILNDFRKWNFRWHFVYNIHVCTLHCTHILFSMMMVQ